MTKINITSPDLNELARNLKTSVQELKIAVTLGIQKSLLDVRLTAFPMTPIDTGALRSNVNMSMGSMEGSLEWMQPYAGYVHYGTYKMAARPFMDTAVEQDLPKIERNLEQALDKIARHIAK